MSTWLEKRLRNLQPLIKILKPGVVPLSGTTTVYRRRTLQLSCLIQTTYPDCVLVCRDFSLAAQTLVFDTYLSEKTTVHSQSRRHGLMTVYGLAYQLSEGLSGKLSHRFYLSVTCMPVTLGALLNQGKIWVSDDIEVIFLVE